MEKEIWKDFEDYEGKYQISNRGNVKSLNYRHTGKERILKPQKTGRGYLFVYLYKDGKAKKYLVHRLVAEVFLDNPEGYTEVNHKDENKTNNNADNLEWCSRSYNCSYNDKAKKAGKKTSEKMRGRKLSEEHKKKIAEKLRGRKHSEEHIKKIAEKHCKPVIAIDKRTGLKLEFVSSIEAERETGISNSNICACCKGKINSCGGFYWMYANNNDAE